jgi:hypothetical protein
MLIFVEGGKPETRRKTLEARKRINNKLNSHMTVSPGIEPGGRPGHSGEIYHLYIIYNYI